MAQDMMVRDRKKTREETWRYAGFGFLFGLLFPIGATLVRVTTGDLPISIASLLMVQSADPLLWIIDTAPIILGFFAGLAGYRQDMVNKRLADLHASETKLKNIQVTLEQRVAERTRELENQTTRLRVAAEITKEVSSYDNPSQLIERVGELIRDRFGYYHTGIFLLDDEHEFAVLTASPTQAGRQMISNGYKLRVGEGSIVGRVAATGEPRRSLDTGLDAADINNPLLPDTRSEMTVPIKAENRVIGVLDVQSDQAQAFTEEDAAIMVVFADHLGIAIERSRLLQRVEANLEELEQAYGRSTRESWKSLSESSLLSNAGYRFDNVRIQPINTTPELGAEAMQAGKLVTRNEDDPSKHAMAAIPIKLRGQPIGVVTIRLKEGYNPNTINTIEQAVERLAASLESARLFEEARARADREQAISQVTSAISSAPEFDAILRTTVEEIGKSFGDAEVSIQLTENLE